MKKLLVTLPKPAPFVYFMTWSLLLSFFVNSAYFAVGLADDSSRFDPWVVMFIILLLVAQVFYVFVNVFIHYEIEDDRDWLKDGSKPLPSMKGTLSRLLKIRSWITGFLALSMVFGLVLMCAGFTRPFGVLDHWYQNLNVVNFLPIVFNYKANERILKAIGAMR